MLREFCKAVGLSLEANDYNFPMEFNFVKNVVINQDQLTFIPENVLGFHPVVCDYILPSEVLRPHLNMAEVLYGQGNLSSAFDKYRQTILLCHEIYGPIHPISALCHRRLSYIYFLNYKFEEAILLIKKAIIIYEKSGEFDSPTVSRCYSELSKYYSESRNDYVKTFKYLHKSWEIMSAVFPKNVSFI